MVLGHSIQRRWRYESGRQASALYFLSLPSNLCSSVNNCCTSDHPHSPANSSVNWFKVTPCDVSSYCDELLSTIPEFPTDILDCCDPDCTSHHSDLNTYCVQLFNCIAAAADLCLPKHCQCQHRSPLSGWNVAAQYLKQSAHFFSWHKVWTECGCPTSGVLIQIKKNSKRRFKYEVRRLRRRQSHIRCEKLASAHLHSSQQEFWKLVKTISKSITLKKQVGCFNHRVVTTVADKLRRQWL